jgi:hypothetical protein
VLLAGVQPPRTQPASSDGGFGRRYYAEDTEYDAFFAEKHPDRYWSKE